MSRELSYLIRIILCGVLLAMAWPMWATEPCVEGYGGYGTPQQEEQWYKDHVAECLERMMAYPKTRGGVIKYSTSPDGWGVKLSPEAYGQSHVDNSKAVADWWAAQGDEWLYNFIPAETPGELCLGYSTGCPIHGGMRGTINPDVHRKYYYQCSRSEEWYYPGCKVKNPTTGEEVTVVDDGDGWTVPEGFPAAGEVYKFKQTWPAVLLKKYMWGHPYPHLGSEANRRDPTGWPPVVALSIMYEATGEQQYAHAQGILLNRLAEVYRTYYAPYIGGGSTRWRNSHHMCSSNAEPDHIASISAAYDLAFEGIAKDESIVKLFATKGDADYNGDGKLTPQDITYNIQKNLFGYMYELMHRFPTGDQGHDKALCAIAAVCQNPLIVADALEPLKLKVQNQIHRDGMYYEDSSSYRGTAEGYVKAARYLEGFCDGEIIKEPIDLMGDPNSKLNKYLACDVLRTCDGRKMAIGDSGNRRRPVGPQAPADGKLTESVLFDGPGFTILRTGNEYRTRKHLLVYFAQSGCGHGHQDQLHLQPIAYGYDLSMQIGYWASGGKKRMALNNNTTNHNTVEVDKVGQRAQSVGTMNMYAITDPVKVCEATGEKVYEQTTLYRRVAALIDVGPDEHFIADIFRVAGGKTHDYLWHSLGGDDAENFEISLQEDVEFIVQEGGSLLGPEVAYMSETGHDYGSGREVEQPNRYSGYSFLKDVSRTRTDLGFTASWLANPAQQIGLRLHMTGAPRREVMLCKAEGYGVVGESPWDPYTVTRHESDTEPCVSIFASVIEPHKGETFVSKVTRHEMQPYTASVAGMEPVAMVVETTRDKTFYIMHNPERDTARTLQADGHSFELLGQWGTVCFTSGKFDYAILANGKKLSVDGRAVEDGGVASGKIVGVDVENNLIEVESDIPIQMREPLDQQKVTFFNPEYSRGEPFPLVGVKQLEGNRYQLDLGKATYLYLGCGKVSTIDTEANTMLTRIPQSKLMNGRHLYDGKHLRLSEKNDDGPWYHIKTTDDGFSFGVTARGVTLCFDEPGTASKMEKGDLFWVYAIAPGDSFEIGNTAVLQAEEE